MITFFEFKLVLLLSRKPLSIYLHLNNLLHRGYVRVSLTRVGDSKVFHDMLLFRRSKKVAF